MKRSCSGDVSSDEDDYAIPPDACGNYPTSSTHSQMHLAIDRETQGVGQSVHCLSTDGNSETVLSGQENRLVRIISKCRESAAFIIRLYDVCRHIWRSLAISINLEIARKV